MSEKKLDLIAQLLAKAERTTPEEAEALMEHASRLMAKYAIDQARVDERRRLHGKTSESIVEESIRWTGTYNVALGDMAASVIYALGSMRVLESRRQGVCVTFVVGYESDVKQALALLRSLEVQAMVAMRAFWHAHSHEYRWGSDWDRRKARDSFIRGFGHGAHHRISANRLQVVEEAGNGTDLVLVSRRQRVDEHVDAMDLGKARETQTKVDGRAQAFGNLAGRDAMTGEKDLTQGRGISA